LRIPAKLRERDQVIVDPLAVDAKRSGRLRYGRQARQGKQTKRSGFHRAQLHHLEQSELNRRHSGLFPFQLERFPGEVE